MWKNKDLRAKGRLFFKANYWKCVLIAALNSSIVGGVSYMSSSLTSTGSQSSQRVLLEDIERTNQIAVPELISAIIGFFIIFMLIMAVVMAAAFVLDAFLYNPLTVGMARFFHKNLYEPARVREVAYAYDHDYKKVVKTMFLREIYTFLWSLLFVIPGIVKSYEYRMVPYLLAEHPDLEPQAALAESKRLMKGNKWHAFGLDLSFLGWDILSVLTMGMLGVFYVIPYRHSVNALLYDVLKYQNR